MVWPWAESPFSEPKWLATGLGAAACVVLLVREVGVLVEAADDRLVGGPDAASRPAADADALVAERGPGHRPAAGGVGTGIGSPPQTMRQRSATMKEMPKKLRKYGGIIGDLGGVVIYGKGGRIGPLTLAPYVRPIPYNPFRGY